jgi:dTDP-4-amino-4,6-dideoxygalactose transaminase
VSSHPHRHSPGFDPEFIPLNRPFLVGTEASYIEEAVRGGWLAAGGAFTARCEEWLERRTGCHKAFLTNSCTAALEAAALVSGLGPGDEVIMPSFTFASTATAFALRGATPVFVDIEPETLTIDPERAADAVTPATRAIVPVHYAGVGCEMDELGSLAEEHGLLVIEDAAQGLLSTYRGRPLGGIGGLGAISFHETKNVTSGEGGALLVNLPELLDPTEIVWEKGTDRRRFDRGEVDAYRWIGLGSSFGASEVTAAFLWAQLEEADRITERRRTIWDRYHEAFADLEAEGRVRRPAVPPGRTHNAHMYYLLQPNRESRTTFIEELARRRILAVFHYVPLHSAPAGQLLGRAHGELRHTDDLSSRLVRLPLWTGMDEDMIERVVEAVREVVRARVQPPDRVGRGRG